MNKTFIECLKEMNPNEMVYVGTKSGASFIVIDTAQTVIDHLDKFEKYLHDKAEKRYNDCELYISNVLTKMEEIKRTMGDHPSSYPNEVAKKFRKLEGQLSWGTHMKEKYRKYLDEWKTIRERPVIETYKHTVDITGTTLIITGNENGSLWFKHEKKSILTGC